MMIGGKQTRNKWCRGFAMELLCMILGGVKGKGGGDITVLGRHLPIEGYLPTFMAPYCTSRITVSCIYIKGGTTSHHPIEGNVIVGVRHQSTCTRLRRERKEDAQ